MSASRAAQDAAPLVRCGPRIVAGAFFLLAWLPSFFGPAGLFIDEAYYLACADRLALGYVDHPPLSIAVLRGLRALLGDSLPALRLAPALAGATTVLLAARMARRLGAGPWGESVAALAVACAPLAQILFGFYSMNAFSMLFWSLCFVVLIESALRDDPRPWLLLGVVAGLGTLNKHTLVLLLASVAAATLATRARRQLATPWPWAGAALAALIVTPNLVWQIEHDWPSFEFYREATRLKNVPTPPLEVVAQQVLGANPLALPLSLAGLYALLAGYGGALRHLGIACLVLVGALIAAGSSRPDRIAGIHPLLFAAGAAVLDAALRAAGRRWLRTALPVAIGLGGAALAPLALPLLPPATAAAWSRALGVVPQIEAGEGKRSPLPQWLADRYGWEQLVDDVAAAVATLEPHERRAAVILGASYGQVAPLAQLGGGRDLPPVYSPHNHYHLWGPPPRPVRIALVVGFGEPGPRGEPVPEPLLGELFAQVELARVHRCRFCMAWRDGMPIWIARRPVRSLREAWPALRRFR